MKWNESPFEDIVSDSAFGPRFSSEHYNPNGNIATLRTTDISNDGFISTSTMPLAKIDTNKFKNHFLKPGDLVISRSGRIGTTALFTGHHMPVLPGAFLIRFRLHKERANPLFYKHYFNSKEGQKKLLSVAQGVAQQNINITNVRKIIIPTPPLEEQNRIAETISTYDNLITTNQRRIALLEEAARLIYREWFINMHFPGHDSTPMSNGAPERWTTTTLGNVCTPLGGGTPSTKVAEYWNGDITWVTPTDVTRNNSVVLLDSEKKISESGLKNSSAKLLPPETILMTSRASIGYFALMDYPVCTNQGFISIIPEQDHSRMYLLFNLMSRIEEMTSLATGSTFKELSKRTFRSLIILWPADEILEKFNDAVYPMIQQIRVIKKQNSQLAQARDLLLPQLMSGQIDVSNIQLPDEDVVT